MAENINTDQSPEPNRLQEDFREYYDQAAQTSDGYVAMYADSLFPELAGAQAFGEFMLRDAAIELVKDHQVRCLADALAHWMMHGSATRACPTYDAYLRAVLHIIECWLGEEGWVSHDRSYRRTPPEDERDWEYDERFGIATSKASLHPTCVIVLPTLVRPSTHVQIWNHPALSKEAFEFARHRRLLGGNKDNGEFYLDY